MDQPSNTKPAGETLTDFDLETLRSGASPERIQTLVLWLARAAIANAVSDANQKLAINILAGKHDNSIMIPSLQIAIVRAMKEVSGFLSESAQ